MLDLLVGVAHILDAFVWIGSSLKRFFYRVFLPRSPRNQPLEWSDWFMLGCLSLIIVLVIVLSVSGGA